MGRGRPNNGDETSQQGNFVGLCLLGEAGGGSLSNRRYNFVGGSGRRHPVKRQDRSVLRLGITLVVAGALVSAFDVETPGIATAAGDLCEVQFMKEQDSGCRNLGGADCTDDWPLCSGTCRTECTVVKEWVIFGGPTGQVFGKLTAKACNTVSTYDVRECRPHLLLGSCDCDGVVVNADVACNYVGTWNDRSLCGT